MNVLLKDAQRVFAGALIAADTEDSLLALVAGDRRRNRERLALYRGNLTQTWHKVLAAAYPVLHAVVGDNFFQALTREYGLSHPSRSGDLNRFGDGIADWLRAWPPCLPHEYLADLARLEWAVHRAYFAADALPLSPEDWLRYEPEALEDSRIMLHPAVELISSHWAIGDIWSAYQSTEPVAWEFDIQRPQQVIVGRPRWIPVVIPVSQAGYLALDALRHGETLGRAIDAALAHDRQFDFAASWRAWIEHGIVVAPDIRTSDR